MPGVQLPGARTGLVHLWAVMLGPLQLLVAGVALLVIGLWGEVDSVAAIGAIGIVASLILPRMKGTFEIGSSGFKGDLENDIYREVIQMARDRGIPAEQAIEFAAGASGPGATFDAAWRTASAWHVSSPHSATRWRLVERLANEFVGESVRLERECALIVERIAEERGWEVRREVRRVVPEGQTAYIFDFVVTTGAGRVFIDAVNFREPQALSDRVTAMSAALRDHAFLAAFVVVPNTRVAAAYVPENLAIVPVGDLERRLREIA